MIKKAKSLLFLFSATNLVALSVVIFDKTAKGSDPLTVLQQGLAITFGIRIGQAAFIYNVILLLIACIISRDKIGIGTIAYSLSVGPCIDFYATMIHLDSLFWLLLPAQLMLCMGFAMMIHNDYGMSCLDAILYYISNTTKINYSTIRTCVDVLYGMIGWLLGGLIGFGTIFAVVTTGLLTSRLLQLLQDWKNHSIQSNVIM